jgi:predicted phage-related endonuclease
LYLAKTGKDRAMTTGELTGKVRELKELKALSDELQAEIAAIEDAIKADMDRQGVDELDAGTFKVTWKVITSRRFDTTAFKATHSELYSQYTKESAYRRFVVR